MIDDGKFAVSDARLMRDINLQQKWDRWFKAGQRVQMSMIFQTGNLEGTNSCPVCKSMNKAQLNDEVEW
jgi:hypothetical protein